MTWTKEKPTEPGEYLEREFWPDIAKDQGASSAWGSIITIEVAIFDVGPQRLGPVGRYHPLRDSNDFAIIYRLGPLPIMPIPEPEGGE